MNNYQSPTAATYDELNRAYDFFNDRLFDGRLPEVLITLSRTRKAHGYFSPERFSNRDGDTHLDEISLNPDSCGRDPKVVLSTLVHEMAHVQQQHEGKPSRGGYHNKEWAGMMLDIGLTPTATGAEGGKMTGAKITHMIDPGGRFDVACDELIATGIELAWFSEPGEPAARKKDLSKVKHTCPVCDARAWAKMGTRIVCGDCDETMEAEETDQ